MIVLFIVVKKKMKERGVGESEMEEHVGLNALSRASMNVLKDIEIASKLGEGNFGEVFIGNWNGD